MQSLNTLRRICTESALRAKWGNPRLLGFQGLYIATRTKSDGASDGETDMKAFYYPNTKVGIKERSVKADQPPTEPLQTPYPPFPEGKNPKTGEHGGPTGPEPTRFGDWERKGRVTDF